MTKDVYDKTRWHTDGEFPRGVPRERAFVFAGMFVAWAIDRELVSDAVPLKLAKSVQARRTSGAQAYALLSCPESAAREYAPGCERTLIDARSAGRCDVQIQLRDGRVLRRTATLTERDNGCCGTSFEPANANEATISVP